MKLLAAKRLVLPLSFRNFRLLWIGQAISALGNPFQIVALVWLVMQLKGSPLDLATTMLALTVPQAIVTLAGGVLIDRFDARTVMLWTDAVRTVTSGTIALLAFTNRLPLWLLFFILLFHGAANGLFSPAAVSIPPRLVPQEALDSANSLMSLIFQLGAFLGAVPAGITVAYNGPAFAFALNSFSFALAVFAALLMTPLKREARSKKSSLFHDAVQGLAYLWRFPWLMTILLMDGCAAIAAIGPTAIGLPLLASNVLHIGSQGYSLLLGSFGFGSVIGILLPAVRSPHHHRGRFFCLVQLLEAPLLAGIAFVPLPLAMLCLVGVGLLNGFLVVLFLSLLQANIAKEMLGRMMSFFDGLPLDIFAFLLVYTGVVFYPYYAIPTQFIQWGYSAVADQTIAGAFLLIPGLVDLVVMSPLFFRWLAQIEQQAKIADQKRQEEEEAAEVARQRTEA